MEKKTLWQGTVKKVINPLNLVKVVQLEKNRKVTARSANDAQLKLYSKILKGDFLHYGYFDDRDISAEDISFSMIYKAQERYAEKILDLIPNGESKKHVLDVGCGMGGLLGMLNTRGHKAIGLTPDINQVQYIREHYPNPTLHCRFEEIPTAEYQGAFDVIITSESLQYLNLDQSLPLIKTLLRPGGCWIACDYFRTHPESFEKSGHIWEDFETRLKQLNFNLESTEDITPHILPTIAFAHLWGTRVGVPVLDFLIEKLKVKNPGWYYLAEDVIPQLLEKVESNLKVVDPLQFSATKKYMLMKIT